MMITQPRMNGKAAVSAGTTQRATKPVTLDRLLAILTVLYLLLMLVVFSWQLFDTWIGRHTFPSALGYDLTRLNTPAFRLVAYTVIGGALGAIVNGIRSMLIHYHGFAGRYVWKYLTAPWMGATLALLVYALLHSSIAVFGGGTTTIGSTQALANFAAGALAGYGSKDVFIWLDAQVHKLFKVEQAVPDVIGETKEGAATRLHAQDQAVGEVTPVPVADDKLAGTVVTQAPAPGASIARGDEVNSGVATDTPPEQR